MGEFEEGDEIPGLAEAELPAPAEAPGRRASWRSVEERGWQLVAEVPGGGFYLDHGSRSVSVVLRRPGMRPRLFTAALFFGPEMRREAIRWARGKARRMGGAPPRERKAAPKS